MEKYSKETSCSCGFVRILCVRCKRYMVSKGWPLRDPGNLAAGIRGYEVYQCDACRTVIRARYRK